MKRLAILFIGAVIFVSLLHSQVTGGSYAPRDYSIVPPSPEVASLVRHADITNDSVTMRYYVRDNLGSTRVVIDENNMMLQATNYYPSGLPYSIVDGEPQTDRLHMGKPFIDHNGMGAYDNSARILNSIFNEFDAADPMSEKYPNMSHYVNCANNTMRFVDPDGQRIVTVYDGETYVYREGDDGEFGFFDNEGNISYNSTIYTITEALNQIQMGNVGAELIDYLINNKNTVTINLIYGKEKTNNALLSNNLSQIYWNPTSVSGGYCETRYFSENRYTLERPPFIGLAHELAHVEDFWKGTADLGIWFWLDLDKSILNLEKYATYTENLIRLEHNLSIRTHFYHYMYKGKAIPFEHSHIAQTPLFLNYFNF